MSRATEYFTFTGIILVLREKAVKVDIGGGEVWLPRSQIEDEEELERYGAGSTVEFSIPAWLAKEKGIL